MARSRRSTATSRPRATPRKFWRNSAKSPILLRYFFILRPRPVCDGMKSMDLADALIFAIAAAADLAVLAFLRWMRSRRLQRERVTRSLALALRYQRI